jgi:predicted AlkP superfamily pyrophosphatase or phosphodiesterase
MFHVAQANHTGNMADTIPPMGVQPYGFFVRIAGDIKKAVNVPVSAVGRIVDAIKEAGIYENSIIIVTADHGGINKGHGGKTMEEMETPFIIAGKNIKKGGAFEESMMQFDCASTIASVFNLEQPQVWIGRPMTQVFE